MAGHFRQALAVRLFGDPADIAAGGSESIVTLAKAPGALGSGSLDRCAPPNLGLLDFDNRAYGRIPDRQQLRALCEQHLVGADGAYQR